MASALQQNTNHEAEALALLPTQFKDNVEMRAMLKSWMTQIHLLETAAFQVLNNRHLSVAVGKQLDVIGRIVGAPRNGRTDEPYRTRLRAQIKLNRSSGTIPQILDLFTLLIGVGQTQQLIEYFPAALAMYIDGAATSTTAVADEMGSILKQAKASGVHSDLTYTLVTPSAGFRWNGTIAQGWNVGEWGHTTAG